MTETQSTLSRRTFVKGSLAGLAATGAAGTALFGCAPQSGTGAGEEPMAATGEETAPDEIHWSQCNVNCGGNCVFQWPSRDGKVLYMETDNTGDTDLQARACLRGRSMRRWLNRPDRLLYPMKRAGKRGEGKFEQITWDEAIDTIASELKRVIDTYGNEAIYVNYATGMYSKTGNPTARLLNLLGGYLNRSYDYSAHMIEAVAPYMYGTSLDGSSLTEATEHSDLIVMFGNSPAETRMGGANASWDFARLREAIQNRGGKIISIDPRMNETVSGHPDEWLPIRPGTDAALCAAIAHEWIVEGKVDKESLDTYCLGYDEDTMPESAKGQNKSYKDYIMGTGWDMVEKTPEWAAPITQIPASSIRELANTIAAAKAPFITQGWGPQRHTNGEDACRSIYMLPLLLGKWGLPGTNNGERESMALTSLVPGLPAGENPVTLSIPAYQWVNAVDHGHTMTATNSGLVGGDELGTDIKFIWNYAGNCITNQHGDVNRVFETLSDEKKCEFIVVCDTFMTDSAKYADILLPDAMRAEQLNMSTNGYSEYYWGVTVGGPAQEPPFECRPIYDVHAEIADRFGMKDKFTAGKPQDEWIRSIYEEGAAEDPEMPSWDQILEQGVWKRELPTAIAFEKNVADPVGNPWKTPSGKIEIYSEALEKIASERELSEGHVISPIPFFDPGVEGYGAVTSEYPLYMSGWHDKARTHSSFGALEVLRDYNRHRLWINPIDAEPRGIENGDTLRVFNDRGEVEIMARVTARIMPGVVGMPHAHRREVVDGVDIGANANTLSGHHWSPISKNCPSTGSTLVQVEKA